MSLITKLALAFLASVPLIQAHTRFTTLHINGQSQGDGVCIRQDQNPGTTTNFVPSITGPDMACGVDGSIAAPSSCSANAGDQISLEHRMWPDGSQPGAIDVSHKGNTAIYMKKISSEDDKVTGGGWFKIFFDSYNTATGEWGTDHMNANNGLVTTTIPSDLAAGDYLVRSEVLALQQLGNPQIYVGCAQVHLSGSGSAIPKDTARIPGYIDASTPAMTVNIYEPFTFTEYGPTVYRSDGSSGNSSTMSASRLGGATTSSASTDTQSSTSTITSSGTPRSSSIANNASSLTEASSTDTTSLSSTSDRGSSNSSAVRVPPFCEDTSNGNNESPAGENEHYKDTEDTNSSDTDNDVNHGRHSWSSWGKWNDAKARVGRSTVALYMRESDELASRQN